MKTKIIPNWFHHNDVSLIPKEKPCKFKVAQQEGNFISLVDEKPINQDFDDYSIKNLSSAGIPLDSIPSQPQISDGDVMSALSKLENEIKNN